MKKINGKSFLYGKSGKYYAVMGLFILAIAFTHFSMQISFIEKENLRSIETANETELKTAPPVRQIINIEPEQFEIKKIEVITLPEVVKHMPRRQKETEAPPRKSVRKKEVRETRAERLRRAERILTGV